jgi:hypothetical protein
MGGTVRIVRRCKVIVEAEVVLDCYTEDGVAESREAPGEPPVLEIDTTTLAADLVLKKGDGVRLCFCDDPYGKDWVQHCTDFEDSLLREIEEGQHG